MATSDITAGRLRSGKDNLGGNSVLYLYNELEDSFTVAAGEATAMNVALTAAYKFEIEGDLNTFDQDTPSDRNTGTSVNTQTLTISLKGMDAPTNANFRLLLEGFGHAVIKNRNGDLLAVGIDDGIDWQITATSGGSKGDGVLYTMVGISTTNDFAPILDSSTVTAFLAVVV